MRCTFSTRGEECGHTMLKHLGNGISHLSLKHGLSEDSPVVAARRAAKGKQPQLQFPKQRFSHNELEALALAEGFRPFQIVEGRFFRLAFGPRQLTAETVRETTIKLAMKFREECVAKFHGKRRLPRRQVLSVCLQN